MGEMGDSREQAFTILRTVGEYRKKKLSFFFSFFSPSCSCTFNKMLFQSIL